MVLPRAILFCVNANGYKYRKKDNDFFPNLLLPCIPLRFLYIRSLSYHS